MEPAVLKERRVALALSQNEVNRRCGFKPAVYAQIERATRPATPEQLAAIAAVFDGAPPPAPIIANKDDATPRRRRTPKLLDTVRDVDGDVLAVVPAKVKRKRAAVVKAVERAFDGVAAAAPAIERVDLDHYSDDNGKAGLHPELTRLSLPKLNETWTSRPAQLQVLKNILHSWDRKVTRVELETIKERMAGKMLRDIAVVAAEILGEAAA